MGCDEAVFARSPLHRRGYSDFTLQICDSQIMTAPSSTSLIIPQQNQTLTELIRDVFLGTTVHMQLHYEVLYTSASHRVLSPW